MSRVRPLAVPVAPLLAALVAVVAGLVVVLAPLDAASARRGASPNVYAVTAHRGASGHRGVTENTVHAWNTAWRQGATAVEADVRRTRDGRLVIFHDHVLPGAHRRVLAGRGCRGRVINRTLHYIRSHCHGRRDHAKVATLDDYLRWGRRHRMNLLVEIKTNIRTEHGSERCRGARCGWSRQQVGRILTAINRHRMVGRVTLISFGKSILERAETIEPRIRTQFIASTPAHVRAYPRGVDQVAVPARLVRHHARVLRPLRRHGIVIQGQRTDTLRGFRTLRAHCVHAVLTDRVRQLRRFDHRHRRPKACRR